MNDIKLAALDKMLAEMNQKHTTAEDIIHNWLCDQHDDKLFQGVLKDGRTIKEAYQYIVSEASKLKDNNMAMIEDEKVYSWIYKYFTADKIEIKKVVADVVQTPVKKEDKPKEKPKKKKTLKVGKQNMDEGYEQLDLLDF